MSAEQAGSSSSANTAARRPNIVFITAHDLGRHLGCYGQKSVETPALDRLAEQGVIFEQAFCTAPQCSPSRAALHTGRYPHANGVLGLSHAPFNWRLNNDERHFAQIAHATGYRTALAGIQHIAHNPKRLGYDETVVPMASAEDVSAAAVDMLETLRHSDGPFYLEVGFFEPHRPYDRFGHTPDDSRGVTVPAYLPDSPAAREDVAALQGAIRALDLGVGRVLDAIDEAGLAEDTWVIFAADHGLAMPRAKGTLYDPGIAVALMMRWPGAGVSGGQRIDTLISYVDVTPTMLDALDLGVPSTLHGSSFWSLLQGEPYTANDLVFAEKTYHTIYDPIRAVRSRTHKLIVNFDTAPRIDVPEDIKEGALYPELIAQANGVRPPVELYDLTADPLEQNNLAGQGQVREVEHMLKRSLWAWMDATEDPLLEHGFPSPQYRAAMDALSE